MPSKIHLAAVARELKRQLNGRAFLTIQRTDITALLRQASGEPTTRLKSTLAAELTGELMTLGVLAHPSLVTTTTGDTVRLYHAGSVLAQITDMVVEPDPGVDAQLAGVLSKVKETWRWANVGVPVSRSRLGRRAQH